MGNFNDVRKSAKAKGILLDGCGSDERFYSWGLYTDFCGMTIEDVKKASEKCCCDHNGNTPSGDTPSTDDSELMKNTIYAKIEEHEIVLTPTYKTDVDLEITLVLDNLNYDITVEDISKVKENGDKYTIKLPSNVSQKFKTGIKITDGIVDGYTISNFAIHSDSINGESNKYEYLFDTIESESEYTLYYGYTFAKNTKNTLSVDTITGDTSNSIKIKDNSSVEIDITIPDYSEKSGYDLDSDEGYDKFIEDYNMVVFITIPKGKFETESYDVIDKLFSLSYVDNYALSYNGDIFINNTSYSVLLIEGENNAYLPDGAVDVSTIILKIN